MLLTPTHFSHEHLFNCPDSPPRLVISPDGGGATFDAMPMPNLERRSFALLHDGLSELERTPKAIQLLSPLLAQATMASGVPAHRQAHHLWRFRGHHEI